MYQHLLVPIDDSPLSMTTVEQAVAYAKASGARLTFFHARADFGATSDGAVAHALSPSTFAEQAAGRARGLLGKAEAAARARNVECASLAVTADRVPDAILQAAHDHGCDLIFMASHGERGMKRLLHGSVTHRLLQRSDIAVLVASVESNRSSGDDAKAIAYLKDEHRSLSAVLRGLLYQAERGAGTGRMPDFKLLRAMVFYVETFPQRLHHPKEEQTLFRLLRQRTQGFDALLDELEHQHDQGQQNFERLRMVLDDWQGGAPDAAEAFVAEVKSFAQSQWSHMRVEEQELLPAASRHLTPADWAEVAAAFAGNDDPRLHKDLDESYADLFNRLLNLAAQETSSGLPRPAAR